jgi:hypothetical protein
MTPAQRGSAMQQVGADTLRGAVNAVRELWRASGKWSPIAATSAGEQERAPLWTVGAGVAVVLVLFPMLGALEPGGSFLAAWATGNAVGGLGLTSSARGSIRSAI